MKRSSLTRHAPLRRSGFLGRTSALRPRGNAPTVHPGRDEAYLDFVRGRHCLLLGLPGHTCWGPTDPHHAGTHGIGQKAPDCTAIPLCRAAHDELHGLHGYFKGWTKAAVRAWEDWQIGQTQADYARARAADEVVF